MQAPANGFMGIAFQSLTKTIPGAIISVPIGNDILIDPSATLGVSLVPAAPTTSGGFSNDGTATTVVLPTTLGFSLPPAGIAAVELADAQVATCGSSTTLGGGSIATDWDAPPGEMVFTYASVTPATFVASGDTIGVAPAYWPASTACRWRRPRRTRWPPPQQAACRAYWCPRGSR